MKYKKYKNGFSLVEIIITISLVVLLAIIGYSSKVGYDESNINSKILSNIKTINNALIQYSQENSKLPIPGGNINFYGSDTSYIHSYENPNTFGVYGNFTEDTLSKKYIDTIPLDPRTNSYYAYGKTKNTNQFEIASVQIIDSTPKTKLLGNYNGEGPISLIREYNGPLFLYDGSEENFPYNPNKLVLIATDIDGNIYRIGDTITVPAGQELEVFFSDGSVSVLGDTNSETILTLNELNFEGKDNLNTIVKLGLQVGRIWTKATRLNKNSKFEITTSDSTAAVRGTIFSVYKNSEKTEVIVLIGEVDIIGNNSNLKNIKVINGEKSKKIEIQNNEILKNNGIDIIESDNINLNLLELDDFINSNNNNNNNNNNNSIKGFYSDYVNFAGKIIYIPIFNYNKRLEIEKEIEYEFVKNWYLYAIADYNENGNLAMVLNDNSVINPDHYGLLYIDGSDKIISQICNLEGVTMSYYLEIKREEGFCKTNDGIGGVILDNLNNGSVNDFIKYNDLYINASKDFAIEVSAYFYKNYDIELYNYLFYINDDINISIDTNKNIRFKNGKYNFENFIDGLFHTIRYEKLNNICNLYIDNNKISLTQNGSDYISDFDCNYNDILDIIDIGNKKGKNQINSIIDYVKIYK